MRINLSSSTIGAQEFYTFLLKWLLLFLCFGYPLQAFISIVLNLDSTIINTAFRVVYLGVCIFLLIIIRRDNSVSFIPLFIFVCFWIIYGGRLIYDQTFRDVRFLDRPAFYVYSFAFGSCFIPALTFFISNRISLFKNFTRSLFGFLLLTNICILVNFIFIEKTSLEQLLLIRVGWGEDQVINPITISLSGGLLVISGLSYLLFVKKQGLIIKLTILASLLMGSINLLLGASRGPFLAVVIVLLFMVFFYLKLKRFSLKILLYLVVISAAISLAVGVYYSKRSSEIFFIERLSKEKDSSEKEDREYEWASALKQFKRNPILGDSFVNDFDKSYAHNLFLDSLKSTGIIGTLFFVLLTIFVFKRVIFILSNADRFGDLCGICFVFLCTFVVDMVSGGLFVAITFWNLSAFLCSVPIGDYKMQIDAGELRTSSNMIVV